MLRCDYDDFMIPVYVIHLPNPERKAKIAAELAKAGFDDIQYVHAKEPMRGFECNNMRRNPRGEFGCALSHVKAIVRAVTDSVDRALFVEDDIEFTPDGLKGLRSLYSFPMQLLYLGGHPRGPAKKVCDGVVKAGLWSCAEAYMFDHNTMRKFLNFWLDRAGQPNAMFDFILGEFAATLDDAYALYPPATQQPPGWSHIGQKFDDKRELIKRGWETNLAA